ncbi:hypothetical protein Ahy_B06g081622 [Arachis hypogaea]|uniref:Myb/SANT-like domain-containing protein n=1 Tax=Arachis hypogaea TaxID=3818 RepID=A0A444YLS0_ARAHY|nr:hypothetical protein Ahy_B06g081622 [Arachis hypogaea]
MKIIGESIAKKMASQSDTSSKDNLRWIEEMNAAFLNALIEECSKGNRVDRTFTTSAYDNVLVTLKASFENHLYKDNLKNRLKTFKDHFGVCYDLFHSLSGFSWNPDTKLFTAEPEVWADLIKIINFDCEWNDWQPITHSTSFVVGESPDLANSNQSNGTQGNHRGCKRKAPMSGLLEADIEQMNKGVQGLTDMLKDENSYYDKSLDIATKQALTAERQAKTAEKQVMLGERQVLLTEEQIEVAKI